MRETFFRMGRIYGERSDLSREKKKEKEEGKGKEKEK